MLLRHWLRGCAVDQDEDRPYGSLKGSSTVHKWLTLTTNGDDLMRER